MNEQLYQQIVLARVKSPHHAGRPAHIDAQGEGLNKLCGDHVKIYITQPGMTIHHDSEGCAIMAASADLMAQATAGKTKQQISDLAAQFETVVKTGTENPSLGELNALAPVSAFPSRIGCATLPWRALEEALTNV